MRQRLIFSINTGRAGSQYLATLLSQVDGVVAHHEAEPTMSGAPFRRTLEVPLSESVEERQFKANAIHQALRDSDAHVYAETNHMFIKTFYDVVLRYLDADSLDVVVLRRSMEATLKSFVEQGFFSERCVYWPLWMATPQGPNAELTIRFPLEDQIDRALSYLFEIEAKAQRFVADHPQVRVHSVWLEQLQTQHQVASLLKRLELPAGPNVLSAAGRRINARVERRETIGLRTTLAACRERIALFQERAAKSNTALPVLPRHPSTPMCRGAATENRPIGAEKQ